MPSVAGSPAPPGPIQGVVRVTLVTGFLGSGKTTLVNHILDSQPLEALQKGEVVAIVNDFAEFNVDAEAVSRHGAAGCAGEGGKGMLRKARVDTVRLQNGCLCCTVQDDFISGVEAVVGRDGVRDLVIETSGVSDPGPICQAFRSPRLRGRCRLDTVVTLVDCSDEDVLSRLGDSAAMRNQVRAADVILLNKVDLAMEEQVEVARRRVEEVRGGGKTLAVACIRAQVNLRLFLDPAEGGGRARGIPPALVREEALAMWSGMPISARVQKPALGLVPGVHSGHAMSSLTFTPKHARSCLSLSKFQRFLRDLPGSVLRGKGFVQFSCIPGKRYEFHLVGQRYEANEIVAERGESGAPVVVVLIGTSLDSVGLERQLLDCVDDDDDDANCSGSSADNPTREFRAMIEKDKRFCLEEDLPWPTGVAFGLRGSYGSFGVLDPDLVEAANRELAARLSKYSLFSILSGPKIQVDCNGMKAEDLHRWRDALGKETFVVLSNLIDPAAQQMYRGVT